MGGDEQIRPMPEHTAISVSSLERSIEFYTTVFGLQVNRTIESRPESRLGDIVGLPGCTARIAHLGPAQAGGAGTTDEGEPLLVIELFEYQDPAGKPLARERTQADLGISHIGFRSPDARGDYRRLVERGVECLSEPVEFRPGVWVFYFRGPDGEVCEMRQS